MRVVSNAPPRHPFAAEAYGLDHLGEIPLLFTLAQVLDAAERAAKNPEDLTAEAESEMIHRFATAVGERVGKGAGAATPTPTPEPEPITPPTTAPTITLVDVTLERARIEWAGMGSDVIAFELEEGGFWVEDVTSLFVERPVTPGQTYTWRVRARNVAGPGPATDLIVRTAPSIPPPTAGFAVSVNQGTGMVAVTNQASAGEGQTLDPAGYLWRALLNGVEVATSTQASPDPFGPLETGSYVLVQRVRQADGQEAVAEKTVAVNRQQSAGLLTFQDPHVAMILHPLTSFGDAKLDGTSATMALSPWPRWDAMELGERYHDVLTRYPAVLNQDSKWTLNKMIETTLYYDLPLRNWIAFHRSGGDERYREYARKVAYSVYDHPSGYKAGLATPSTFSMVPRRAQGRGLILTALDEDRRGIGSGPGGQSLMWDCLYRIYNGLYNTWVDTPFSKGGKTLGHRDPGYAGIYYAILAHVLPDTYVKSDGSGTPIIDGEAKREAMLDKIAFAMDGQTGFPKMQTPDGGFPYYNDGNGAPFTSSIMVPWVPSFCRHGIRVLEARIARGGLTSARLAKFQKSVADARASLKAWAYYCWFVLYRKPGTPSSTRWYQGEIRETEWRANAYDAGGMNQWPYSWAGTVSLTNGSALVTGSGTDFLTECGDHNGHPLIFPEPVPGTWNNAPGSDILEGPTAGLEVGSVVFVPQGVGTNHKFVQIVETLDANRARAGDRLTGCQNATLHHSHMYAVPGLWTPTNFGTLASPDWHLVPGAGASVADLDRPDHRYLVLSYDERTFGVVEAVTPMSGGYDVTVSAAAAPRSMDDYGRSARVRFPDSDPVAWYKPNVPSGSSAKLYDRTTRMFRFREVAFAVPPSVGETVEVLLANTDIVPFDPPDYALNRVKLFNGSFTGAWDDNAAATNQSQPIQFGPLKVARWAAPWEPRGVHYAVGANSPTSLTLQQPYTGVTRSGLKVRKAHNASSVAGVPLEDYSARQNSCNSLDIYGWMYAETGDPVWLQRGDEVHGAVFGPSPGLNTDGRKALYDDSGESSTSPPDLKNGNECAVTASFYLGFRLL